MSKFQIQSTISLVILLFISIYNFGQIREPGDTIYVANWNLENFFDTMDDPQKNDAEFLPTSKKKWDIEKFDMKLAHITSVINYMNNGCGPDIIGFEEVENINVMKLLSYSLRDRDYIIAHRSSPDIRGIDVALFYDRNVLDIVDVVPIHVKLPTRHPTRDILHVKLKYKSNGSIIHVFVNHWPSRIGGEEKSEPNRIAAAKYLKSAVDSLMDNKADRQIIIIGDFNDEPDNKSITGILNAGDFECGKIVTDKKSFDNLSYKLFKQKEGTYLYRSNWNMLDQIIISPELTDDKGLDYKCGSFEIIKPDFMVTKTGKKKGAPLPTYIGNKYIGGYSDHFPVGAKFYIRKEE